ncbi:hypothetical protein CEXT_405441 [Caerostris extrusa]|uniref:Uncharacterized protein n=1 Tax=Caerostris extrusa TaxID=172846 RepID=A0AAV4NZ72_CAEEX|nr:hypothetical protein CEXT_405441 [Caerostris extrusa]
MADDADPPERQRIPPFLSSALKTGKKQNTIINPPQKQNVSRTQPFLRRVSNNSTYADIIAGRTNHQAPPIIRPQAPPATGAKNAPLSESALELFKLLLVFMNDSTIDFDQLLDAVTHALPALEATDDHHMKAVILLKHYNYLDQNHNV